MVELSKLPLDMVIVIISFITLEDAIRFCLMQKEGFQLRLRRHCSSSELREGPTFSYLGENLTKEKDHHESVTDEKGSELVDYIMVPETDPSSKNDCNFHWCEVR